jgi:Ca2+-binding EF-hand superfamily protein
MKNKIQLSFLAATLLCLGAQSATAGVQDKLAAQEVKMLEPRFAQADKNSDGKLTPEEAKAGMPMVAKYFTQIDKTNSGFVTLDDIKAAMASGKMAASSAMAK